MPYWTKGGDGEGIGKNWGAGVLMYEANCTAAAYQKRNGGRSVK